MKKASNINIFCEFWYFNVCNSNVGKFPGSLRLETQHVSEEDGRTIGFQLW
jgi:hypothetical protein